MKNETKSYWICLNNPAACENVESCVNLTGEADCELCPDYMKCSVCGRKGIFCDRCTDNPEGMWNVNL